MQPIEADILRIRDEFLEAPGIRVSAATAARLVGVSLEHASEMLKELSRKDSMHLDRQWPATGEPGTCHDRSTRR